MSGRSRRLALGVLLVVTVTGVALATPVGVLAMSGGRHEVVARLVDGDPLVYTYRQSIYGVPVREEFVRTRDAIALLRVRSSDIRSVEYFRWDGDIVRDDEGLWTEPAPANTHRELLIAVTGDGEQRIASASWSVDLLSAFGERTVSVRVEQRPLALVLVGAIR